MRSRLMLLTGSLLILILLITACIPDPIPPPVTPPPAGQTSEGTGGEPVDNSGSEPSDNSGEDVSQLAENVAVMEGSYDVEISSDGGQIIYKVATQVENVVGYYQEVLPGLGWEMAGPQDTAIGNTALMLRQNAENERLSINMQYNPNGDFTVITLVINKNR